MRMLRFGLVVASLLWIGQSAAQESDLIEDPSFLRVSIGERTVRLEGLIVRRKDATGKLPVVLIAHGKPATQGRMLDDRASEYLSQARDFARRGWLAVVAMRRGFGGSDGPAPVSLSCASPSLLDRFASEADDLQATLDLIAKRPEADPTRMIAIGVSAGGAAVAALSARNPKGLAAVINVSGDLRFPSCPKEDALVAAFKDFGAKSRVPNLWIYARNDSFFSPQLVERMQNAFLDGGGDVKLVMLEADERFDGHTIFRRSTGRGKWLPQVDAFLRFHKLPTWTRDDVNALIRKLNLKEASRGFIENYVAGPSEKAMSRQKDGTYMTATYGARSIQEARKASSDSCERRGQPCEVVMENDRSIGAGAAN